MIDWIKQSFEYEFWALGKYLDRVKSESVLKSEHYEKIISLLSHCIVAQRIWIDRITNVPTNFEPWSAVNFQQLHEIFFENQHIYNNFLSTVDSTTIQNPVLYKNTKGTEFSTPIIEILQHITHHSAYHRGQLSYYLKADSLPIPTTDYILFVRERTK